MSKGELDADRLRGFGGAVDFGRAAGDYATHRAGFPPPFFDALTVRGLLQGPALDIGTGTGTIARGLARAGLEVSAVDPSAELMEQAAALDAEAGVAVHYARGKAEALPFDGEVFGLVVAGQCWHWFDRPEAAAELARVLRPGGIAVIAHFDWLPLPGSLVAATEALILRYNPDWPGGGGTGLYPAWFGDLTGAGFTDLQSFSLDVGQPYTAQAWRGRIRASAGVKASLDADGVAAFDADLAALMAAEFPGETHTIPHRVWAVWGRRGEA